MATDRELAAQSMMSAGIGSLSGNLVNEPFHPSGKEYRSFQTRSGNEPEAMAMERYAFDKARQGGNYPWNIDIDLKSNWRSHKSPFDPPVIRGNVFQSRSGNKSDINKMLHLDPKGDIQRFYNQKFVNQATAEGNVGNLTDAQRKKLFMMVIMNALSGGDKFIKQKDEDLKSGIMQDNLGGAKVWQAGGPFEGDYPLPEGFPGEKYTSPFVQKYISRPLSKLFGNEVVPEEFDPMLNPDMHGGPPVDNEGNLLPGWELHQDGTWNYYPPEFEGDDAIMDTDIWEAQSQWKRPENVRSLLDYIMEKIGGDESDARKYIFDNFGLKLPQLSLGVNRGGIIGLI